MHESTDIYPLAVELIEHFPPNPTMESLVRFLIGFVFIYQLLLLGECKVIRQSSGHEKEISEIAGSYEVTHLKSSHATQVELNGTSINYPNATRLTASDVNSSANRM